MRTLPHHPASPPPQTGNASPSRALDALSYSAACQWQPAFRSVGLKEHQGRSTSRTAPTAQVRSEARARTQKHAHGLDVILICLPRRWLARQGAKAYRFSPSPPSPPPPTDGHAWSRRSSSFCSLRTSTFTAADTPASYQAAAVSSPDHHHEACPPPPPPPLNTSARASSPSPPPLPPPHHQPPRLTTATSGKPSLHKSASHYAPPLEATRRGLMRW